MSPKAITSGPHDWRTVKPFQTQPIHLNFGARPYGMTLRTETLDCECGKELFIAVDWRVDENDVLHITLKGNPCPTRS